MFRPSNITLAALRAGAARGGRRRSWVAPLAIALLAACTVAGCGPGQPAAVHDIEATAAAVTGTDRVRVDELFGGRAWAVSAMTDRPAELHEAVLSLFDGRGYPVTRTADEIRIGDSVSIADSPLPHGVTMVAITVGGQALDASGYPTH